MKRSETFAAQLDSDELLLEARRLDVEAVGASGKIVEVKVSVRVCDGFLNLRGVCGLKQDASVRDHGAGRVLHSSGNCRCGCRRLLRAHFGDGRDGEAKQS